MSVGFARHGHSSDSSGFVDPKELLQTEDLLDGEVQIDQEHDVPFCAGMSKSGKVMYVDHTIDLKRGGIDRTKPLLVHETVEWVLMKMFGMKYLEAHALGTACENACVDAAGYSRQRYNQLWDEDIRRVGSRGKYRNIPSDLQTEQYEQEGTKTEKREMGLMGGGKSYGTYS